LRGAAGAVVVVAAADVGQNSGLLGGPAATVSGDINRLMGNDQLTLDDAYVLALVLLVLARGLVGRRRLACQALLALVAVDAAMPPYRLGQLAFFAVLAVALIGLYAECLVRPDPRRLRAAGHAALGTLVVVLVHGGWLIVVERAGPGESARAAVSFGADQGGLPALLFVVGFVGSGLLALILALAPATPPPPGDSADRRWVRRLVDHPDAGSLAPFATRADKAYVFSPDRQAAIGYRVLFGVAIAGGDPVGAASAAPRAIVAFMELCATRGWRPAVLGAGTEAKAYWHRAGLRQGVVIGDEAVIDVATFSLTSRRMRNVRQAVRRSVNSGVRVQIGRLDEQLARQLAPVLADWLRGRAERGFAMNLDQILVPRDDVLVAVGYDDRGVPQAFARFARCAGDRVLTLDVAPRRRDAPNGIVERLIIETVRYGRERGVREVSLNFAGMRQVFTATGRLARLATAAVHVFDRWIELRPLYRFTAKFDPRWRPRSLLLRSWWEVGPVGVAALVAEFGRTGGSADTVPELAEQPAPA
jgi:lysyl-tRNA synthetase class 2